MKTDAERDELARAAFLAATEIGESRDAHAQAAAAWEAVGEEAKRIGALLGVPFVPGPPKPAPPPQQWPRAYKDLVTRHRDGDFEPDRARIKPGLDGFLASMAQSFDYGAPIRSSAAGWEAHANGDGAIGTAGFARPPDSMTAREEYSLAQRELSRIADELPPARVASGHTFDGPAQMRLWTECHGPGALTHRAIRGGPERHVKGMGTVPASPVVTVPERRKRDATDMSENVLAPLGIVATPHEIGLICRRVTQLVEAAFVARGWVRERRRSLRVEVEGAKGEGDAMAKVAGYDLESWKEIAPLVGRSEDTCRALAKRAAHPLPVEDYLGRVVAKRCEIEAWVSAEVERGRRCGGARLAGEVGRVGRRG